METETVIEKNIRAFVSSKTDEDVCLDVSKKNLISIKRKSKVGSIALAMFWLRVFRHQNNYPMPKYPYKELYDKQGNNKVILKVDTVTLTVFMSTGTLLIQGNLVIDWFLRHFQSIMDHYDAPVIELKPDTAVFRQYTETWKKAEEEYNGKKAIQDEKIRNKEYKAVESVDDRGKLIAQITGRGDNSGLNREQEDLESKDTKEKGSRNLRIRDDTEKYLRNLNPDTAFYDPKSRSMQGNPRDTTSEEEDKTEESEGISTQVTEEDTENDLVEEMELMSIDKWSPWTVEEQLNKLRTCCVRDGSTYIYKLWQSILYYWFSDPDCRVYLVTPFLDSHRLADICHIILQHKLTANLDAVYVRQQCDRERKIHEVKRDTVKQFKDAKDQMFIEHKIFSNIIYPMKRFHAKFMACVKAGVAQVLVTSANFHADHFEHSNMETVHFQTMSETRFINKFLGPINASVTVQK